MANIIICVGGTGQMVLHYYVQLYLLGIIDNPFKAIVIDTDDTISSLKVVNGFLGDLQYGPRKIEALGADVPLIDSIKITPTGGDTAMQVLSGVESWDKPNQHPTQAFFNNDVLGQDINVGLFARPALSSVVCQSLIKYDSLRPTANSTVVIVGSIIGGTGGGLIAPVIDAIHRSTLKAAIQGVRIRAVIFGKYFKPDENKIQNATSRFLSNQILALRSIQEALKELHSYYIVGGTGDVSTERNPDKEKGGDSLSWPDGENHPLWQGVKALEYMLTDTSTEARPEKFEDREISLGSISSGVPFSLDSARQTRNQRLQIVQRLVSRRVIKKISTDSWTRFVWGERLNKMVARFWSIDAKVEGGKDRVKDFPEHTQDRLKAIWFGRGDQRPLRNLFPTLAGEKRYRVKPRDISRIVWPDVKTEPEKNVFKGVGTVSQKAAATIMFWALRKGK